MGKFEIKTGNDGKYYYNLKAGNGEVILTSPKGYGSSVELNDVIASVKHNAVNDARYEKLTSKDDQYFFRLTNEQGDNIGKSELYATAQGRNNGIESVKKNAPTATIA